MNSAARERFDRWFEQEYPDLVIELEARYPGDGLRRARSSVATAYRFWGKVEADGNPKNWILRDAGEPRPAHARTEISPYPSVSADSLIRDKATIVRVARQRRVVATVVLSAISAAVVGAELFAAHR